eukprot:tig00020943_g16311.t1
MVKIIASDTEEDRGDHTHRWDDSQHSSDAEGQSSRDRSAARRHRRRSSVVSTGAAGSGHGRRGSASGGAGYSPSGDPAAAISKRKLEQAGRRLRADEGAGAIDAYGNDPGRSGHFERHAHDQRDAAAPVDNATRDADTLVSLAIVRPPTVFDLEGPQAGCAQSAALVMGEYPKPVSRAASIRSNSGSSLTAAPGMRSNSRSGASSSGRPLGLLPSASRSTIFPPALRRIIERDRDRELRDPAELSASSEASKPRQRDRHIARAPRPPSRTGEVYLVDKSRREGNDVGGGDGTLLASRSAGDDSDPAPAGRDLRRKAAGVRVAPLPAGSGAAEAGADRDAAIAASAQQSTYAARLAVAGDASAASELPGDGARGGLAAVSRGALSMTKSVRFRVWACLFGISLIAVATFLACFFLAAQTRSAVDELSAVGRVGHALADLRLLSRELYVGDGALGLGAAALARRVHGDVRTVHDLFEEFKFGSDGTTQRATGFDSLLYGNVNVEPADATSANLAEYRGLSVQAFSYLEATLNVLKTNGHLSTAGALVETPAPGPAGRDRPRYEGWEDGASFGDPSLRAVRTELAPLLAAFDRVTAAVVASADSSVAFLRSILAAVLVADTLAIALIYALLFRPMLRRLQEESSRAAQLLRMIPAALLASAQLSIRDLLPTSWHPPKK